MRKMFCWLGLVFSLLLPASAASAQAQIQLARLQVQLWPEYDQPSMLVIYDFELQSGVSLPARVTFHIPRNANLIAVASQQNGGLVNASFEEPVAQAEDKTFTIIVTEATTYHFEYYQPLVRVGAGREFDYLWAGEYAVDEFIMRVQQPLDTTTFSMDPPLIPTVDTIDGLTYYANQPVSLAAGAQFALDLNYEKTSDALTVPASGLQPAEAIDENTTGRISASDYLPYVLLAVIVLLVLSWVGYYYLSARIQRFNPRRARKRGKDQTSVPGVHCHQCGQRARSGDRYCRVCGTRLRAGS